MLFRNTIQKDQFRLYCVFSVTCYVQLPFKGCLLLKTHEKWVEDYANCVCTHAYMCHSSNHQISETIVVLNKELPECNCVYYVCIMGNWVYIFL